MIESIQQRINRLADGTDRQELGYLFAAMQKNQEAMAASINQLIEDHNSETVPTTADPVVLFTKM